MRQFNPVRIAIVIRIDLAGIGAQPLLDQIDDSIAIRILGAIAGAVSITVLQARIRAGQHFKAVA